MVGQRTIRWPILYFPAENMPQSGCAAQALCSRYTIQALRSGCHNRLTDPVYFACKTCFFIGRCI